MDNFISRRKMLQLLGYSGAGLMTAPLSTLGFSEKNMRSRVIPSTAEELPVVGLGTWIQFDVGTTANERDPLRKVLHTMDKYGGKVIDSSPMYGNAQQVVGDLTSDDGLGDHFFYATKVWTRGRRAGINQMQESMKKMRRTTIDLMQVHNLLDWQTHLKTLRQWKSEGKVRYVGVTHHTTASHAQLEKIIETKDVDFVQCNYSIADRHAGQRLLPAAKDNGVAVLINEPYGGGSLFGAVKGQPLPGMASEYEINSWGQFFLKYILSHPAVTCVIPGTSDPEHAADNMLAGFGPLPDDGVRKEMQQYFADL